MRKRWNVLLIAGAVMALAVGCGAKEETKSVQETMTVSETVEAEGTTAHTAETEKAPETADDNFSVDPADAEDFGRSVKEAVAAKNLEKLADMTAFPVYIGFEDGGISVESKEEMTALGEEKIFTQEWMDSIAQADETALSPSMAGFVLTGENGGSNIVFGMRDGELAVSGINY